MPERKDCAICKSTFTRHRNARTFYTRQLCIPCRKIQKERTARDIANRMGVDAWRKVD